MHICLNLQTLVLVATDVVPQSDADVILRTFIGMAFIMVLMWLAVIVTARIGRMSKKNKTLQENPAEKTEIETETGTEELQASEEISEK